MRERAPLRRRRDAGVDGDAARLELRLRAAAELVVAERGEEEARAGEVRELDGGHRAAACGLLPRLARVDDLARGGQLVDARELDPLDMSDDSDLHGVTSHLAAGVRFMLDDGRRAIPPFERFYETHRSEVLAFLRRRAGRDRADDLFQETFLRALRGVRPARARRAPARVGHDDRGEHARRRDAARTPVGGARASSRAARIRAPRSRSSRRSRTDLPPKERAAVVLRYGYALDYDEIGAALGSSEDAARQAASAGVRRLREGEDRMTGVPATLDARFRAAAAATGVLDVAYDVLDDTPVGALLVGVTRARPLPRPLRPRSRAGARRPRAPLRPARPPQPERGRPRQARARRVLLRRARTRSTSSSTCAGRRTSTGSVLAELARVEYGTTTTYGALAARVGAPKAARAVGTVMNRNPIPIVLPCHRVVGASGSLTGYGGGLERKEWLLRLEGALL